MVDFKRDVNSVILREWNRSLKSTLKDIQYKRDQADSINNPTNDPTSGEPYFDPVTEQWVYPDTPTEPLETTFKALVRKVRKYTDDYPSLQASDIKITVRYDDFISFFGEDTIPMTTDKVSYRGEEWRVIEYQGDSVDCFYHIFIRRT